MAIVFSEHVGSRQLITNALVDLRDNAVPDGNLIVAVIEAINYSGPEDIYNLRVDRGLHQREYIDGYEYEHITVYVDYSHALHLYMRHDMTFFRYVSVQYQRSRIKYSNDAAVRLDKDLSYLSTPKSLFQGYDCISGNGLATGIEGTREKTGGTSSVYYSVTKSISEIYEKLDISASLSVGLGGFANVSAKIKFVDELKLTEESICILVRACHIMGVYTATHYDFKIGVLPTTKVQIEDFVQKYGDAFISELRLGAEYYAVYTFHSQSKDQKKNVDAELKANGIGTWGKVDGAFQQKLDHVVKTTNISYAFNQNISGIDNPVLPKPDNLVQYSLDFLSLPVSDPAVISYATTGYERVPGMQADLFDQIRKNRRYFAENSSFSKALASVTELLNKIGQIRDIYEFYSFVNDKKIDNGYLLAKTDLNRLQQQLHQYEDQPDQEFKLPELPSLLEGIPVLNFRISYSDERGGTGGSFFDDVNPQTYLEQLARITEIKLYAGSMVDCLEVTYQALGQQPYSIRHGNSKGGSVSKLPMRPGVFIKALKGRSGASIDRLNFIASDSSEISGGGSGGSEFTFNLPVEGASVLIGFSGRSGAQLDQIRAVYATLLNAQWVSE